MLRIRTGRTSGSEAAINSLGHSIVLGASMTTLTWCARRNRRKPAAPPGGSPPPRLAQSPAHGHSAGMIAWPMCPPIMRKRKPVSPCQSIAQLSRSVYGNTSATSPWWMTLPVRPRREEARLPHVRRPERAARVREEEHDRDPGADEPPGPYAGLRQPEGDDESDEQDGVHREPDRDRLAECRQVLHQRPHAFPELVPVHRHLRSRRHRVGDKRPEREHPDAAARSAGSRHRHGHDEEDEQRNTEVAAYLVDPARKAVRDRVAARRPQPRRLRRIDEVREVEDVPGGVRSHRRRRALAEGVDEIGRDDHARREVGEHRVAGERDEPRRRPRTAARRARSTRRRAARAWRRPPSRRRTGGRERARAGSRTAGGRDFLRSSARRAGRRSGRGRRRTD